MYPVNPFNKEAVQPFKDAKAFIDNYKTLDANHPFGEDELKAWFLELKEGGTAKQVVDKTAPPPDKE